MAMKITPFLFAILAIWAFPNLNSAVHHHHAAPVPAPAVDCSSVILNMADCLSFVTSGSTVAKPEGTCCSGLKTVLKTNAECLCEVLKHSGDLGISLNVTKAMTLPSVCHLSAPSLSNCKMSTTTGPAPALSPMGMSPSSAAVAPTTGSGAPPPSVGSLASSTLISVMSLVSSLLLVSLSLF